MIDILKNKLGETDLEYLNYFCTAIAEFGLMELNSFPCPERPGDFNQATFKELHKFLFKDVFEWAGTYDIDFSESKLDETFSEVQSLSIETTYQKKVYSISKFLAKSIKSEPFAYGSSYTSIAFVKLLSHKVRLNFNTNVISSSRQSFQEAIDQYEQGNKKQLHALVSKATENYRRLEPEL